MFFVRDSWPSRCIANMGFFCITVGPCGPRIYSEVVDGQNNDKIPRGIFKHDNLWGIQFAS